MATFEPILRFRSRRGFTAIELIVAISILAMVCMGGVQLMVAASNSYNQDITRLGVEQSVQVAMRQVTDALRPAISVIVDTNGEGITFYYPQKDAYGHVINYGTSDGIARRIYRGTSNTSNLYIYGRSRPIMTQLRPASASYPTFALRPSGKAVLVTIRASATSGAYSSQCNKSEVVNLRSLQ